jgi:hypothetical protein
VIAARQARGIPDWPWKNVKVFHPDQSVLDRFPKRFVCGYYPFLFVYTASMTSTFLAFPYYMRHPPGIVTSRGIAVRGTTAVRQPVSRICERGQSVSGISERDQLESYFICVHLAGILLMWLVGLSQPYYCSSDTSLRRGYFPPFPHLRLRCFTLILYLYLPLRCLHPGLFFHLLYGVSPTVILFPRLSL